MAMKAQGAPSLSDLGNFNVNRPDLYEAIRQPLYDFTNYAAAGQTQLQFFQTPVGQSGKTLADTNMRAAGQMPQPQFYLIKSIQVKFYPGVSPGLFVTTAAVTNFANDVYAFAKSGYLELFIGSKSYLDLGPLDLFPAENRMAVTGAYAIDIKQATAADAQAEASIDYAATAGKPFFVDPAVLLVPNQNFSVTLNWPTAVSLPSGQIARIGVMFDGYLYRQSQ
jgi:hypothetical protein